MAKPSKTRYEELRAAIGRSPGRYATGYRNGLGRWLYGEHWGESSVIETLERDSGEAGRGYRDGLAGREPSPRAGGAPPAAGVARGNYSLRLTAAEWARFQSLGGRDWLLRRMAETAEMPDEE